MGDIEIKRLECRIDGHDKFYEMIVHDDGHTNVISYDALESIDKIAAHNPGFQKDKFDLILTNPPFGSTVNGAEKPYLSTFELGNTYDKKGKAKRL